MTMNYMARKAAVTRILVGLDNPRDERDSQLFESHLQRSVAPS